MAPPACPTVLKQIYDFDRSSPDFPDQLNTVLCGQEYRKILQALGADELRRLVDYLDKVRHLIAISYPLLKPV